MAPIIPKTADAVGLPLEWGEVTQAVDVEPSNQVRSATYSNPKAWMNRVQQSQYHDADRHSDVSAHSPSTNPLMTAVTDYGELSKTIWKIIGPEMPLYLRTEVMEIWDLAKNTGTAVTGALQSVPELPPTTDILQSGFLSGNKPQLYRITGWVEGGKVALPTMLDDVGSPGIYIARTPEVGSGEVKWCPESGLFVLERSHNYRELITVIGYVPGDAKHPALKPYAPVPEPFGSVEKSQLSAVTRSILDKVILNYGDRKKYGDYALTLEEQAFAAAVMLRKTWTYEMAPKGFEHLAQYGTGMLKYFHSMEGIATANCGFANTELAEGLRSYGIPAHIVHGFLQSDHGDLTMKQSHAWVEVYDGKRWHRVDATPGPANKVDDNKVILQKLAFLEETSKPEFSGLHTAHMALSALPLQPSYGDLMAVATQVAKAPPVFTPPATNYITMPDGRFLITGDNSAHSFVVDLVRPGIATVAVHRQILGHMDPTTQMGEELCRKEVKWSHTADSVSFLRGYTDSPLDPRRQMLGTNIGLSSSISGRVACTSKKTEEPYLSMGPEMKALTEQFDDKEKMEILSGHWDAIKQRYVLDNKPDLVLDTVEEFAYTQQKPWDAVLQIFRSKSGQPWDVDKLAKWLSHNPFERVDIPWQKAAASGFKYQTHEYLFFREAGLLINKEIFSSGFSSIQSEDAKESDWRRWHLDLPKHGNLILAIPKVLARDVRTTHAEMNTGIEFSKAVVAHKKGQAVTESDRGLVMTALRLLLRHPPTWDRAFSAPQSDISSVMYLLEAARTLKITNEELQAASAVPEGLGGTVRCDIMEGCELKIAPPPQEEPISNIDGVYRHMISLVEDGGFYGHYQDAKDSMDPNLRRWMDGYIEKYFKKNVPLSSNRPIYRGFM